MPQRAWLLPISEVAVEDVWHTDGTRATGTKAPAPTTTTPDPGPRETLWEAVGVCTERLHRPGFSREGE